MCLTLSGWVNLGRRSSPRKTRFPSLMVRGGRMVHTSAASVPPPASPNLLPACSREGSGDEAPSRHQPCHRRRQWKRAWASPPARCAPQLRAGATGQSTPTACCDTPSPMPEFSRTPQENHMAEERVRASSSSSSLFTLNRPNGLESKAESSSHIPYPGSQGSPLCPKCPDAALHHSSLQAVPMPQTALHPSCATPLHVPSADLQPCLAHTGTGPITLLSRPERSSDPGQLDPLPPQHGGITAD